MILGVVVVGAVGAGGVVRGASHTEGARRLWWVAAVLGGGAAGLAWVGSPVPVAAGLAAGGLVGAAVVDAVEYRIPTPVAHGTTAVSLVALAVSGWDRDDLGSLLVKPALLAAALAAVFALLWLPGWVGFGDVRLAAATVTAMVPGSGGPIVVGWVAFFATGVLVAALRLTGRRRKELPFGPGLVVGWLVAVALTYH